MEQSRTKEVFVTLAVLVAMVFIVGGAVAFGKQKTTPSMNLMSNTTATPAATASPASPSSSTTPVSSSASSFKNGTYSSTASYETPSSTEAIKLTLTLQNDVVTNASLQNSGNDRTSRAYQEQFLSAYKSYVVGKKLSSINVDGVSGSSLTTQGFDSALQSIENQATA